MNIEIKNISAVLPDNDGFSVQKADIFIQDDIIAGINAAPENFIPDRIFSRNENKLLIPGLINTHTHSYMSLFRNIADDLPFSEWLFDRIEPLEDKLTGEDAYWGALLSCTEMIKTGTTCFADMHMFKNHIVRAVHESKMRAVLGRGLVGSYENGAADDGGRLKESFEDIDYCRDSLGSDLISFFLAPHAVYTCSPEYLRHIADTAQENSLGIHIHLAESRSEFENCMKIHNMTPTELLSSLGVFRNHTLAAHCVYVTDSDIRLLSEAGVSAATNPVSNMKLGNGFAPVVKLMNAGVNVSLGTDSAASNNSLNLFREMGIVTLIHKGINEDSTSVSAAEGFCMATKNGAEALNLQNLTGAVKTGMKADLVIMNLDTPGFNPRNNLISALSYSSGGSEAETVIINGEIVMEAREMKTIDTERVYFEADRICSRII